MKNVVVIGVVMFLYGDEVSVIEIVGYVVVIVGFVVFNYVKVLDNIIVCEYFVECCVMFGEIVLFLEKCFFLVLML